MEEPPPLAGPAAPQAETFGRPANQAVAAAAALRFFQSQYQAIQMQIS